MGRLWWLRRLDRLAWAGLVDLHWVTVEGRVGKQLGGALEVEDGEPALAQVFAQPRAPADDLFEQRHRLDVLVQHDQLAGLRIHARAHQLGSGGDDRVGLLGVDEVVELALALGVVAGDLHHVVGLAGAEVGVGVAQGLAHTGGVLDVLAEDDRLVVAVRGFQVFGDLGGHHLVAALQHQLAVHVRAGVDPVFDDVAQLVGHALGRAPAEGVLVQVDADDLVRGQVAILDALAQAVGVDGLAEVVGVGDVGGLLGRGRQADLGGGAEVAEDVAPGRVFGGAAAVALVDDDEVEEVGRELLVDVALFFRAADGLVQRQVDLVALVDLLGGSVDGQVDVFHRGLALTINHLHALGMGAELGHGTLERPEVVDHGLVDQDVPVGQEQDALLGAALPQPPDDLERGVGLARAGGHDQQRPVLAACHRLDRAVDSVQLVVAWGLGWRVVVLGDLAYFGRPAFPGAVTRPQLGG